jgi:hypothetical protein
MMESKSKQIRKAAVNNGVVLGIISCILGMAMLYLLAGTSAMAAIIAAPVGYLVVLIVIDAVFSIDLRKKAGGYWRFREAVSGIFTMLLIAYLLSTIVSTIFTQVIDKDVNSRMKDNMAGVMETFMTNQGADPAAIDTAVANMKADVEKRSEVFSLSMFTSFLTTTIFLFTLALILAAILKKESPLYDSMEPAE